MNKIKPYKTIEREFRYRYNINNSRIGEVDRFVFVSMLNLALNNQSSNTPADWKCPVFLFEEE